MIIDLPSDLTDSERTALEAAKADLRELGLTYNDVARTLHELGITGDIRSGGTCPLTNYLVSKGHQALHVTVQVVLINTDSAGDPPWAALPIACQDFVHHFDQGEYPTLIAPEGTEPA